MGDGSIVVGLAAAIAAALLLSLGLILQALESREIDASHGLRLSLVGRLVRRPRWIAGTAFGYLAFPFQVAALTSAPLVVVQPVHACGLLLVLALGAKVMHEPVGTFELAGVAGIVAGIGMVAWGAPPGGDPAVSQAALAGATGALVVPSFAPFVLGPRCGRLTLMVCAGLGFAGANMAVKGFTAHLALHHYLVAAGYLAFAGVGSISGTLSQMTAFQRHRASEVVPVTFVVPIFLPVVLAIFVLREHWASAAFSGAPFAAGGFLLLLGTYALARAKPVVDVAQRAAG
jgi:drug/metabolite transporter (DMT)-like permease